MPKIKRYKQIKCEKFISLLIFNDLEGNSGLLN
jgi:hypothetical protein